MYTLKDMIKQGFRLFGIALRENIHSLKVAQSWFYVLVVNQHYLKIDKSISNEKKGISKLI